MSTIFDSMTVKELNPHFTEGNIKVGLISTFNKLAGNVELMGCKGTCGGNCKGCWTEDDWQHSACYNAKSYVQYKEHILSSHIKNTLAIRLHLDETYDILNKTLSRMKTVKPVRIHSAGEIETAEELKMWIKLASKHSERPFYVYTKNFEVLDNVMSQMKRNKKKMLPDNMYILVSVWHESGIECYKKWKGCKNIKAFVYDDGQFNYEENGLKIGCHCPAYRKDEKGHVKLFHDLTCDKCKLCFNDKVDVIGCLDH